MKELRLGGMGEYRKAVLFSPVSVRRHVVEILGAESKIFTVRIVA